MEVVKALGNWGARWLDLAARDYDSGVVLWSWARLIDVDRLPERRVVVRFDLTDQRSQR
ncbi:MAG: hypothetical protein M3024_01480 [Candidatus Dormibacteraeota bacterium]|nr:hypothetical protein [Candidatus Dormibacteraeota bacterium]